MNRGDMTVSGSDLLVELADAQLVPDEDAPVMLRRLRTDLLDLDVAAVDVLSLESVPEGAKSVSGTVGALAVKLAGPAVLKALVARVRDWVTRNGRSVEITLDGDTLKLTGVSRQQQDELIAVWLARHEGGV